MAYIQKQRGKYRARFSDPLGNDPVADVRSQGRRRAVPAPGRRRSSARPMGRSAQRRHATRRLGRGVPVAVPSAVADDAGDLSARPRQVRAAAIRCIPTWPVAGRRDRELVERRDRCRHRPVVGSSPLPDPSPHAAGRRSEAEDPRPTRASGSTRRVPKREMTFLDWDQVIRPRRGAQRAIPGD